MSRLIERTETVHVNVKDQDELYLKEGQVKSGTATLIFSLNPYNAESSGGGTLYVNGLSCQKLEELRAEIERYLQNEVQQRERRNSTY